MKHLLYACILAGAAIFIVHATPEEITPGHEIIFDDASRNQAAESPACNDPACNCSMLLQSWLPEEEETFMLRSHDQEKLTRNISRDVLHDYGKKFVQKHFPILPRAAHQESVNAHNKAQATVARTCTMLMTQLTQNNTSEICEKHLKRTIEIALSTKLSKSKLVTTKLITCLDAAIRTLFRSHDYELTNIPHEMKKEFDKQREKLTRHLKKVMHQRKTDVITPQEIQNLVTQTYSPFIQRMQYIHLWNWAMAETANLRNDDPDKTASSYLIPNPKSKKLRKYVSFLDKRQSK